MFVVVFIRSTVDFQKFLHNVSSLVKKKDNQCLKFPGLLIFLCIFHLVTVQRLRVCGPDLISIVEFVNKLWICDYNGCKLCRRYPADEKVIQHLNKNNGRNGGKEINNCLRPLS